MTLPFERFRAVNHTREFLMDLIDPALTPKVPKRIRQRAAYLLKHYPAHMEMERVCDAPKDNPVFSLNF